VWGTRAAHEFCTYWSLKRRTSVLSSKPCVWFSSSHWSWCSPSFSTYVAQAEDNRMDPPPPHIRIISVCLKYYHASSSIPYTDCQYQKSYSWRISLSVVTSLIQVIP
jgi:hypothetical protein